MVPNEWNITTLGEHVSISSGYSPSKYNLDVKGPYPFVKVEDMNNCVKYQQFSRNYTELNGSPISKGAVIFPKRGAAIMNNKVRITATQMYLDTNMMSLMPQESLSSEFLYYTLVKEELHRIADTSTIPQINNKHILPYRFKLPPLPEQRKIAKILSTWDKAISATERLIDNSKQQKKALMQQLLTGKKRFAGFTKDWKQIHLGGIGKCITGLTYKPSDTVDDGMLVLRSSNIQDSKLAFEDNVFVNANLKVKSKTQENDILVCVRNGSKNLIGKSSLIKGRAIGQAHGAFMTLFRGKYPLYVSQLFQSNEFFRQVNMNLGATINSINTSDLHKFKFSIPTDENEINAIAACLSNAEKEIEVLQQQLADLKQEKKALMQQLLTGKRRVKVDDEALA